jgi:hypothetical protein
MKQSTTTGRTRGRKTGGAPAQHRTGGRQPAGREADSPRGNSGSNGASGGRTASSARTGAATDSAGHNGA